MPTQTGSRPRPGSRRTHPVDLPCTLSCPTRQTLDRLADRWTALLLGRLATGPKRYGQLRDSAAGLTEKMLTQTLRGLERDGLVSRRVGPGVPAPVEYELTHLGRTLLEPLAAVRAWATDHIDEVEEARVAYDRDGRG